MSSSQVRVERAAASVQPVIDSKDDDVCQPPGEFNQAEHQHEDRAAARYHQAGRLFRVLRHGTVDARNAAHEEEKYPDQQLWNGESELTDVEICSTNPCEKESEQEGRQLVSPIVSAHRSSVVKLGARRHGFATPASIIQHEALGARTHALGDQAGDEGYGNRVVSRFFWIAVGVLLTSLLSLPLSWEGEGQSQSG